MAEEATLRGSPGSKEGRKSSGVCQLNAVRKEKRSPSASVSKGRFSVLPSNRSCSGLCGGWADKERQSPRNPATAKSARLVMEEFSAETSRAPAKSPS